MSNLFPRPGTSGPTLSRRGLLASGAGLTALALAACSGPAVGGTGTGASQAATDETDWSSVTPAGEISFWTNHPGGSMDIEKKIIEGFQAENPDIKVELVTAGKNYEEVAQKFQTAQAGGEAGDLVVISDVTWFNYYLNKSIIPVDGLWEHFEFEIDDYRDALIKDYEYEGAHWGVPYARSTPLFYYNKEHFATAGLADEAPKTWQEFGEVAPTLIEKAGVQAAFAFPKEDQYPGWTLANVIWGYGGAWSNEWDFSVLDGPETVEGMQFVQDAVRKQKWGMVASSDQAEAFASGAVSTVVQSTGSLAGILKSATFDVGVGFLPGGPKATDMVCPTGGAGIGIAAKSSPEKQLAAAMFLQYLSNPENSATFSAGTGYMPTRKSADMKAATAEVPQLSAAVEQLDHTRVQDLGRVALPGGDLNIARMTQTVMTSDVDVQQQLTELRGTLEQIYETDLQPKLGG
ncbi:ABC transporter substrate-binding protein [Microlunatus sp. Y2014]|uniref:ABC transporter substrate-binding protein n=1 Tax=Microlunatus sp. Y2014 TaxID=3418488 RepID=UPI003DA77384